jgi:hypothetical protein
LIGPETDIWFHHITEGFFRKKVVQTLKITNRRVSIGWDDIALDLLDDIVVMNQHRVSESNYTSFGGMRGSPRIGTGKSKSKNVGDIVFIYQGNPRITFRQIPDPQGVARLAKAARKRLLEEKKAVEKMNKARLQEQQQREKQQQQQQKKRISITTTTNKGTTTCPRCNSKNPEGSKYCNNCGLRLADVPKEGVIVNQTPTSPSVPSRTSSSLNQETQKQDINTFLTWESPAHGVKINYPSNWRVGKG